ncbi:hypothetical protein KEM52_002553 [Ascosphaera acerosa]|nr:hypothetical protein KEM52_002553 [Ascosphaera acerosa]
MSDRTPTGHGLQVARRKKHEARTSKACFRANAQGRQYLQNPYYFMECTLHDAQEDRPVSYSPANSLAGTAVSSLHRLKDVDNSDGGFFVFGDISVKIEGEYRLKFSLFEMRPNEVVYIKSVLSKPFTVSPPKNFPGMSESTFLSRSFADQGVKLRIRKEPRTLVKRALPRPQEYAPVPPRSPEHGVQPMSAAYAAPRDYSGYYNPAPDMKRMRPSVDMAGRPLYEADPRYAARPLDAYQHQMSPYHHPAARTPVYVPSNTPGMVPQIQGAIPGLEYPMRQSPQVSDASQHAAHQQQQAAQQAQQQAQQQAYWGGNVRQP